MFRIAPLASLCLALAAAPACDAPADPFVEDTDPIAFRPTWGSSSNGTARFNTSKIGDHVFAHAWLGKTVDDVTLKEISVGGDALNFVTAPEGWLQGEGASGNYYERADLAGSIWLFDVSGHKVRMKITKYSEETFVDQDGNKVFQYPVYTFVVHWGDWQAVKDAHAQECEEEYGTCVQYKLGDCEKKYEECLAEDEDDDPHLCDEELILEGNKPYPSGRFRAVFYEGWSVDTASGKIYEVDPEQLYIACLSGAMGKSATWGYPAWRDPAELQANTRLIRADYCGDGTSYTEDGTALMVADRYFDFPGDPAVKEAGWGMNGANWVANTRNGKPLACALPPSSPGFADTRLPL